jgi:amino acid transporter
VGVALDARHTYALAKNRLLPRYFMRIDPRQGTAQRALAHNLAVIIIFMLPFGGWQDIVSVIGNLYLLIYASSAVAVAAFRAHDREHGVARSGGQVPGLWWMAPLGYVVASEFVFWSGWHDLRLALPLALAGVPLYLFLRWGERRTANGPHGPERAPAGDRSPSLVDELWRGAWLVVHLLVLTLLSWLGSFGGSGRLPAPYDTLVVAVVALAVFVWAVRSSAAHLRTSPPPASPATAQSPVTADGPPTAGGPGAAAGA